MASHFFTTWGAVKQEIESWRPRNCLSEAEYRNSLYDKLEGAFRKAPTKEYGHGRVRADIAFERGIGIELKKDLDTPPKLQRLVGQLTDYAKTFTNTFVVLVGSTDRGLLQDLVKKAKGISSDIFVIQK